MIGFRVDANEIIATGHLMRCLSIADAVKRLGGECIFFMTDDSNKDFVFSKGFECVALNSEWNNLENEIEVLQKELSKYELSWLVVDSYYVTERYIEKINDIVPVMGLDINEDSFYRISAILNYSHLDEAEMIHLKYRDKNTIVMTGLQYAPLRKEFEPENHIHRIEKQILITSGGTDPYNISYKVAYELIKRKELESYKIVVVLGRLFNDIEIFELLSDRRIIVLQNVSNMAELMQKSEIVITSGGTTSIELCACQTPTVCFSFVDNQIPFSKALNKVGALVYVGDVRVGEEDVIKSISDSVTILSKNYTRREQLRKVMRDICDGKGALRIANFLLKKERKL